MIFVYMNNDFRLRLVVPNHKKTRSPKTIANAKHENNYLFLHC